jgi:hypothetical protein
MTANPTHEPHSAAGGACRWPAFARRVVPYIFFLALTTKPRRKNEDTQRLHARRERFLGEHEDQFIPQELKAIMDEIAAAHLVIGENQAFQNKLKTAVLMIWTISSLLQCRLKAKRQRKEVQQQRLQRLDPHRTTTHSGLEPLFGTIP